MAAEAKEISRKHKKWILQLLKDNDGEVTCKVMFQHGEQHHCDSLGALLRVLKAKDKAIDFEGIFLFDNTECENKVIKLVNPDFDPDADV